MLRFEYHPPDRPHKSRGQSFSSTEADPEQPHQSNTSQNQVSLESRGKTIEDGQVIFAQEASHGDTERNIQDNFTNSLAQGGKMGYYTTTKVKADKPNGTLSCETIEAIQDIVASLMEDTQAILAGEPGCVERAARVAAVKKKLSSRLGKE